MQDKPGYGSKGVACSQPAPSLQMMSIIQSTRLSVGGVIGDNFGRKTRDGNERCQAR